jgi:hypothetical protein
LEILVVAREKERERDRGAREREAEREVRGIDGGWWWGWRRYAHVWLLASAFPGKKKG